MNETIPLCSLKEPATCGHKCEAKHISLSLCDSHNMKDCLYRQNVHIGGLSKMKVLNTIIDVLHKHPSSLNENLIEEAKIKLNLKEV
jgi:hypothetical protein